MLVANVKLTHFQGEIQMSWSTSGAGKASDVAAKIEKDLAVQSYDDAARGALKGAIAGVARAVAGVNPDLIVAFETNGHADKSSAYGTVSFKTYQPAPPTETPA
jgi:hypothetical protein